MEMEKRIEVRINSETQEKIKELMDKLPNDYPSEAAVLRAGIYSLMRWKLGYMKTYIDLGD
jgi:hypothetical protein